MDKNENNGRCGSGFDSGSRNNDGDRGKNSGHHSLVKSPASPLTEDAFQQESLAHMSQAKQWALACIMFAADHQNQLPKDFAQMKIYARSLSSANWEIVSGGNVNSFKNPSADHFAPGKRFKPVSRWAILQSLCLCRRPRGNDKLCGRRFCGSGETARVLVNPARN